MTKWTLTPPLAAPTLWSFPKTVMPATSGAISRRMFAVRNSPCSTMTTSDLEQDLFPGRQSPYYVNNSISCLPTELLLVVFKYVYSESLRECESPFCPTCPGRPGIKHYVWPNAEDLTSEALFPYSLTYVCRKWRAIMSTIPAFWTRLVFFVDREPVTSEPYLEWSRNLPIEVTVKRRVETSAERDVMEGRRVRTVMQLLRPHIGRCETLRFAVIQSSSLPALRSELRGGAPLLTKLILDCKHDDGGPLIDISPTSNGHNITQLVCPVLATLTVDGRNFRDMCEDTGWIQNLSQIIRLTILHFNPAVSREATDTGLSLTKALDVLKRDSMPLLFYLRVSDLHFDRRIFDSLPNIRYEICPTIVELEDLDVQTVRAFVDLTVLPSVDSLYLTRSPIDEHTVVPDLWSVTLEEIDDAHDLVSPFAPWRGGSLDFVQSSGFNDAFLRMMRTIDSSGEFGCQNLQELHVVDCVNFTVPALKKMVEVRNRALGDRQATVEANDDPPIIVELNVTGRGPALSPDDAEWFNFKVALFHWDTTQL